VKVERDAMPTAGVMTNSWSSRTKDAAVPLTVMPGTLNPRRSRSKRAKSWVAVAVIRA
jgi:hypothetical protein